MSQKFAGNGLVLRACVVVLLGVSSCSKEKESAAISTPAPPTENAPAVSMKEPGEAAATGAVKVRARFDGYAARVAKGLWQPVKLAEEVANFGLITPLEEVSVGSGLMVDGGPEGLAVGTLAGTLQTVEGRPLLAGREYTFEFSKGVGAIWALEITAVP